MAHPADLGVLEAARGLARREISSRELTEACLARISERDGTHSFDGDPASVNAWVRVYEEDALSAADAADEWLAARDTPTLCGVPIALKDLYAVAGKPLTGSSRVLDDVPERDCEVWARLRSQGMVLLGHVHTHELAAGGTTDQVGNPWDLSRSPGGSSGGSAAALATRTTPAATGTDTAGSLRIPSAFCGTSTVKPTFGRVPMRGIFPLAGSLDHAGPMARTVADCEPLLAAMTATTAAAERRQLRRVALSPRIAELERDVADGLDRALAELPMVAARPPDVDLEPGPTFLAVLCAEMLAHHRGLAGRRDNYRPSVRGFLDHAESSTLTAAEYASAQGRRREDRLRWLAWFEELEIDAIVEPTVPIVARTRGAGYDKPFTDTAEISLTHYWDWVGLPVVTLPSGLGSRSGMPTSVSLVGTDGDEWNLLGAGAALQDRLGVPVPLSVQVGW